MKIKVLFFLLFVSQTVFSQVKIQNLYFNSTTNILRLNFTTDPPEPVYTNTGSGSTIGEGIAHTEDTDGNIIAWVNASGVYDKNGTLMPGSSGILANPSSTEIVICPFPNDKNKYYVFYNQQLCSTLNYAVVDMAQRGGLGDIVSKNNAIEVSNTFAEGLEIIRIPCTNYYWLITYQCYTGFKRFKIDASGIGNGVLVQSFNANSHQGRGELDYFNGKIGYAVTYRNRAFLADFDPVTGTFSNSKDINFPATNGMYGLEFSPDAKKAYFTDWANRDFFGNISSPNLFCYDFLSGNISPYTIAYDTKNCINTEVEGLGQIELGKDGKLYIPHINGCQITVIENPNDNVLTFNKIEVNTILSTGVSDHIQSDFIQPIQVIADKNTICSGESVQLTVAGGSGYTWKPSVGIISGNTFTAKPSVSTIYKVFSNNSFGCQDSASVEIKVIQSNFKPVISVIGELTICNGNANPIKLIFSPSGQTGVQWFKSGLPYSLGTLFTNEPGNYQVSINSQTSCPSTSDSVSLKSTFLNADLHISGDSVFCKGKEVVLSVPFYGGYQYQWYKNETAISGQTKSDLTVNESGQYKAIITKNQGCSATSPSQTIEVLDIPEVELGDDITLCGKDTYTLDAQNESKNFTYQWSDNSSGQRLQVKKSGKYTVTVSNKICSVTDSVTITLMDGGMVFVPNVMTLNNDKHNNTFQIVKTDHKDEIYPGIIKLSVFNRWGKVMFSSEHYHHDWEAEGLPAGLYYYSLIHAENCFPPLKGWLEIIR